MLRLTEPTVRVSPAPGVVFAISTILRLVGVSVTIRKNVTLSHTILYDAVFSLFSYLSGAVLTQPNEFSCFFLHCHSWRMAF